MAELLGLVFVTFFAGITTSFQPCLFPLLPSYLSYKTHVEEDRRQGFYSSVYLTLGIMVVFLSLTLLIKLGSAGLAGFLTSYFLPFNTLMALLLFFLGIIMLIGFNLPFTSRGPELASRMLSKVEEDQLSTSFFMGLGYTLIAAPCAAPVFLALLPLIVTIDFMTAIIIMVIFSIGAGIPFLIIGIAIPDIKLKIVTTYHKFAGYVTPISGIFLILISFYLLNLYVLPYNPLNIGLWTFSGIQERFLSLIYIIGLGLFLIALILIIAGLYFKHYFIARSNTQSEI